MFKYFTKISKELSTKSVNNLYANLETKCRFLTTTITRKGNADVTKEEDSYKILEYKPNIVKLKLFTHNDRVEDPKNNLKLEDSNTENSSLNSIINRPKIDVSDPVVQELLEGIKNQKRSHLARGITLIESLHPVKRAQGQTLVREVLAFNKDIHGHSLNKLKTFRIGLSGPPGAGKSTHIETLGKILTERGHKVAVLAVDPSSSTTGGSLLGDKTRMLKLAVDPNAYIRPSPTCGTLGGVTRVTNDAIVLCEGAGYDFIIVETVGVGQSEFAVADMVDMFELLLPPAGGDELQGIKKGIVEVADMVVVNKSDGDLIPAARRIQMEYVSALKFIRKKNSCWKPCVMRVSSITGDGMAEMLEKIEEFRNEMSQNGELQRLRRKQYVRWMHNHLQDSLNDVFKHLPLINDLIPRLEEKVILGTITPGQAADKIIRSFIGLIDKNILKDSSAILQPENKNIRNIS